MSARRREPAAQRADTEVGPYRPRLWSNEPHLREESAMGFKRATVWGLLVILALPAGAQSQARARYAGPDRMAQLNFPDFSAINKWRMPV